MYPHMHKYMFETKSTNKHKHTLLGCTDYMIGIDTFHLHTFYGISSYNGHTHYFSGFTGLPIKTENGHVHKMEGKLEITSLHEHIFRNYTDEDIEYIWRNMLKHAHI